MLTDGLVLTSGATFPITPADGQNFRLTAVSGAFQPGQYWYDATASAWVSGDITGVIAGTGLTGGGLRGDVTLAVDPAYIAAHAPTYSAGNNVTIANNVISATVPAYTAGNNVTIANNVISATVPAYTAGNNVTITNNVISATVPAAAAIPYDIGSAILGKPAAAAVVLRFAAVRSFTIPANFAGSIAKSAIAATGASVLTLAKNGVSFGTITFAAAGTSGVFSQGAAVTIAAGDVLTVTAPAVQDATFADCEYTVAATL